MNKKPVGVVTKNVDHHRFVNQSILEGYTTKAKAGESAQLSDSFEGMYKANKVIKPLFDPLALVNILEMNTYHMRCVKTKARDSAGLGWKLEPIDDQSETETELAKEFKQAMKYQQTPLSKIFEQGMVDYDAIGYCSWELVRENENPEGRVISVFQVPAHTVRIHGSKNKFVQIRGTKKVWFKRAGYEKDVDMETGSEHELGSLPENRRAREMAFWSDYTPRSTYYGLPSIIPAIGAIHGDISRRDYNISFFENYGVPAYAVFITGNFDLGEYDEETGQTEFEKSIADHFEELNKNPHSALIMSIPSKDGDGDVNVEFKPLSVETKEASFRLYREDNRDEVLSAHGIPPYRLGIAETGSLGGSTARESTEIYKESVIRPRQEWIEEMMNRYVLLTWGIEHHEFKLHQIDTTDEKHDKEMMKFLFGVGGITPNQIIQHFGERFGLSPVDHPAMDSHYLRGNPIDADFQMEPGSGEAPETGNDINIPTETGEGEDDETERVVAALNALNEQILDKSEKWAEAAEKNKSGGGWFK